MSAEKAGAVVIGRNEGERLVVSALHQSGGLRRFWFHLWLTPMGGSRGR